MRIAFLTPEYVTPESSDGGLANYLRKVSLALVHRDCDVWVFVQSNRDAIWHDNNVNVCEVRCDNKLSELLIKLPMIRNLTSIFLQFASTRNIARKFWNIHSKTPFDIIQASSYMAPGFGLLNNRNVPVVCRISSYTPSLRIAFGWKRNWGDFFSDWMELRQVCDSDACFSPSHFVANMFLKAEVCELSVLRTPIDMNKNGVDNSFFIENRPKGRYLLFFGTLSRIKGVDLFRHILPIILEKHSDLSMVFIGRDDGFPDGTKMISYIKSACNNYAERVHYHQCLNKARLYPFIEHAEAVLMPSRVDNYPNACLEAQMFGIPVIGTYESSLDEMIDDGITGFLARNGDAESIIEGIERCLCQSDEDKKQLRQRIQSHVESIEHEDRIGQLLSFYKGTIDKFLENNGNK